MTVLLSGVFLEFESSENNYLYSLFVFTWVHTAFTLGRSNLSECPKNLEKRRRAWSEGGAPLAPHLTAQGHTNKHIVTPEHNRASGRLWS